MAKIIKGALPALLRRLGSLAAGGVAGMMAIEPELAARLEAWVAAGAFLICDLIIASMKPSSREGR